MNVEILSNIPQEPPREVRLFAFGETDTSKGKFVLDESSAQAVLDAFKEQGTDRLAFDYGHGMVQPTGSDSHKAAGWFVPEVRGDGLYASDIQWTDPALEALSAREYRFFSPAFLFDSESRKLTKLLNVALTNIPATKNQTPLVLDGLSADETKTKETIKMQVLLDNLGAQDEASAVAALSGLRGELSGAREEIAKLQALADKGIEAQTALAEIEKERAAEKRGVAIEALCAEGKLLEGQKEFAALLSDEQFEAFASTLQPHPALKGAPVSELKSAAATLSQDDKAVFAQLGLEAEKESN